MKKKSLTVNAFLSSIKTLATIIFPLITYPYITRILSVENIGKVNFGQSIVSYFSLLAGLGISSFAIRNGSQIRENVNKLEIFANRIFTINIISTILSCVLLVGITFLPTKIVAYRWIILIQGITVALSPLAVDWIYTIYEDFAYITARSIIIQIITIFLLFTFVKKESDVYLYVALTSMSTSLGNVFNFIHSRKYVRLRITSDTHWREYKDTILLFFINSIATIIYMNSDTTILGIMKDDYSVGLYSVAVKIYMIVKQVFNAVIATMIPRLAYLRKNSIEEFNSLTKKLISIATVCTIPASVGIIILRKEIICLISGDNYLDAAVTLGILSIAIVFAILANILANGVLICMGRERYVVRATIVSALENAVLNIVFIYFMSQNGAALTTLFAEITVFGMALYYSRDIVVKMIDWREFRNAVIGSAIMFATSVTILNLIDINGLVIRITVIISICVGIYGIVLLCFKDKVLFEVLNQIRNKIGKKK